MIKSKIIKKKASQMPYEDMFGEQDILDIHNFGPMFHFEIQKLINDFLEESYQRSLKKVKIITGKGNIVRPMTIKILKKSTFVSEYRFAGYFTGQNGAIEIILNDRVLKKK